MTDTQRDTQYCIRAVVDYSVEQGREHDVVAVRCSCTIYKGGPIAEDCISSCKLFEPRVKYSLAGCSDFMGLPGGA